MKKKTKILKLKSKKDFREILLGFKQFDLGHKLIYIKQIIFILIR